MNTLTEHKTDARTGRGPMKDAEHGPTAWAWSPHAASFAAPPSYSACTAASRTVWPALHAKQAFQSEQLLKQDLFVGKHARPQRSAWTDFALHAHCGRTAAPASKETALAPCSGGAGTPAGSASSTAEQQRHLET